MTKPIKDSKKPLQEPSWWSKYWFYTVLILLAVIGVPSAFFIPALIPGLINDGNSIVSVRQGILAVLAGALTMLTLSETHRKIPMKRTRMSGTIPVKYSRNVVAVMPKLSSS